MDRCWLLQYRGLRHRDLVPTSPTWISGTTGVAIGEGMVLFGTTMQAVGVGILHAAGDTYNAFRGGVGVVLAAPQSDITAFAPTDPTDAAADYITYKLMGPNPC